MKKIYIAADCLFPPVNPVAEARWKGECEGGPNSWPAPAAGCISGLAGAAFTGRPL